MDPLHQLADQNRIRQGIVIKLMNHKPLTAFEQSFLDADLQLMSLLQGVGGVLMLPLNILSFPLGAMNFLFAA